MKLGAEIERDLEKITVAEQRLIEKPSRNGGLSYDPARNHCAFTPIKDHSGSPT